MDSPWPHVLFVLLDRGSTTERDITRTKTCHATSFAHADQTQALLLVSRKHVDKSLGSKKA
ncbi:hypothetical protein SynBIOSU31_02006 [Synechococcus sp. BIOS-U3-1]|nr:hypothetical protein SynBIOSU31_02006 [Synechococcus sp. BIOS-U3-1]